VIIGVGAAMNFDARQIDAMSLWEFVASSEGYRKAHAGEDDKGRPPTPDEHDDRVARLG